MPENFGDDQTKDTVQEHLRRSRGDKSEQSNQSQADSQRIFHSRLVLPPARRSYRQHLASWFFSFSGRWPLYVFPFFLLLVEIVLRSAFLEDITTLIGPSLAATGAAFVVPLTVKRPMTLEKLEYLKKNTTRPDLIEEAILKNKLDVTTDEEQGVINICSASVFVLVALWVLALYLAVKHDKTSLWLVPVGLIPGLVNCLVGLILTELREGVI
jgi:hypothetical protein